MYMSSKALKHKSKPKSGDLLGLPTFKVTLITHGSPSLSSSTLCCNRHSDSV